MVTQRSPTRKSWWGFLCFLGPDQLSASGLLKLLHKLVHVPVARANRIRDLLHTHLWVLVSQLGHTLLLGDGRGDGPHRLHGRSRRGGTKHLLSVLSRL